MNAPSTQRTIILGTSFAAALVVAILVLSGGRTPAPAQIPAPAGEAALPMLEGVNPAANTDQTPKTSQAPNESTENPAKANPQPGSATPLNR